LLVKGWNSRSSWGFPKGKVNKDERETDCAIREVLEETDFDITKFINELDNIELTLREQKVKLFIIPGVPEDTYFHPRTRKEISKICWVPINELPTTYQQLKETKDGAHPHYSHNYFMVVPFVNKLKQWIHKRKKQHSQSAKLSSDTTNTPTSVPASTPTRGAGASTDNMPSTPTNHIQTNTYAQTHPHSYPSTPQHLMPSTSIPSYPLTPTTYAPLTFPVAGTLPHPHYPVPLHTHLASYGPVPTTPTHITAPPSTQTPTPASTPAAPAPIPHPYTPYPVSPPSSPRATHTPVPSPLSIKFKQDQHQHREQHPFQHYNTNTPNMPVPMPMNTPATLPVVSTPDQTPALSSVNPATMTSVPMTMPEPVIIDHDKHLMSLIRSSLSSVPPLQSDNSNHTQTHVDTSIIASAPNNSSSASLHSQISSSVSPNNPFLSFQFDRTEILKCFSTL
jgi:mRNA-decapping enzyme subunit 2